MILFTVSTVEILILVVIGLLLVALIGVGLIHYAKVKMEEEVETIDEEVKAVTRGEQIAQNTKEVIEDKIEEQPVVEPMQEMEIKPELEPSLQPVEEQVEALEEWEEFTDTNEVVEQQPVEPEIIEEPISEIEPQIEEYPQPEVEEPKEEETYVEEDVIDSPDDTYEELEHESYPSFSEVEEDEKTEESLSEIELLLREMQSDLENQDKNIHTFEEEQEEKAIISYQELKAKREDPTLFEEVEMFEQEQEEMATSNANTFQKPEKKQTFSNSEFISPVYGKIKNPEPSYPKIPNFKEEFHIEKSEDELQFDDVRVNLKHGNNQSFEETFDLGPMSKETKSSEAFLQALKDFRNNLE